MTAPRAVTPVGILAERLTALADRAAGTDLADELAALRDLAAGLDPYAERCTTPESPALQALAARTRSEDWGAHRNGALAVQLEQEMLSGHLEGQLLAFLVRLSGARRVLEVGLFTGYSALAMAEALPPGGTVDACEIDPFAASVAQEAFPPGAPITVHVGPAAETLARLDGEGRRFDLVFVDADKAGYAGYLDQLLGGGLLADGGLVVVDNTLLQGRPWTAGDGGPGDAIRAFDAQVAADPRVVQVLLPVRDGVTLIMRAPAVEGRRT